MGVQLKIQRANGSLNPKKNPAMRRRFNQREVPVTVRIVGQPFPNRYLHPIRQKAIGLFRPDGKNVRGAFGGCSKLARAGQEASA